jgi:hypothetical protein
LPREKGTLRRPQTSINKPMMLWLSRFYIGDVKCCLHRRQHIKCCRCRQRWRFEKMGRFLLKSHRSAKTPDPHRLCKRTFKRDVARDNAKDGDSDSHHCTCHGHLGRCDINRNSPICVALPKVAMASTMVTVAVTGIIA